jgi:hypothetical protein
MNIFWLSNDPVRCAQYHCDKHVVKMIVEYAQLLSTAVRITRGKRVTVGKRVLYLMRGETISEDGKIANRSPRVYLVTHQHHPCSQWVNASLTHWQVLLKLALALCEEYTVRYGKTHACEWMLRRIHKLEPRLPTLPFKLPPQCMPEQYHRRSTIAAYKAFYVGSKSRFAVWRYSKTPTWYTKAFK